MTEACGEAASAQGRATFLQWMRGIGLTRPRLKILSLFRIGAEEQRLRAYESWETLRGRTLTGEEAEKLQCSSCRMVTSKGVYVCPILIDEPRARMGDSPVGDAAPVRAGVRRLFHVPRVRRHVPDVKAGGGQ